MSNLIDHLPHRRGYRTTRESFPRGAAYEIKARRSRYDCDTKTLILKTTKKIAGLIGSNSTTNAKNYFARGHEICFLVVT
jgi:hypothetical protein